MTMAKLKHESKLSILELVVKLCGWTPSGEIRRRLRYLFRRVFKLNEPFKADFLDAPAFDVVWDSF